MRIRVPRSLIALGILLALLCLLPSFTSTSLARPIGPDPWADNPTSPPPPSGDNDGGVLARSFARTVELNTTAGSTVAVAGGSSVRFWTDVRTVYRHAGIRGLLAIMRLDTRWLGPR